MWFEILSTALMPGFIAIKVYVFQKLSGAFIPAFFIAGAMATFIPKSTIIKYLSAGVKPIISYPVSLVSGGILSVCACGILPLFQTIFQRGAGVGPAITFLFSGPAINIIAIVFTYQLLGTELGNARIVFVLILALSLGLGFAIIMGEPARRVNSAQLALIPGSKKSNNLPKWMLFLLLMGMVLSLPIESIPWSIKGTLNLVLMLGILIVAKFGLCREESVDWLEKSWFLMKNILPKLLLGVFMVGILEPFARQWMISTLTSNSLFACFLASFIGGILYVGTILGVVAVKGLVAMGMPEGPALSLLLAGPSVALPSMFVIVSICGKRLGFTFAAGVIFLSTLSGWVYANFLKSLF